MTEYYETTYDLVSKKNADLEAILFGYEDCKASHAYGPTLRPYHLFHFVTAGEGMLQVGGRCFQLSAGDAFLIPAEQMSFYQASATDPWSYAWVGITGLRASQYVRQILTITPEHFVIRGLETEKYAMPIRKAAEMKGAFAGSYFYAEMVLYKLFSFFAADLPGLETVESAPSLASQIKFLLDTKYMERLRIENLAEHFSVHPNHFSRLFRESYGMSPKQYLQKMKLEKAAMMLETTDMPVALISESLGFEDQHGFSKSFKKYWGISPREFRQLRKDGKRQKNHPCNPQE